MTESQQIKAIQEKHFKIVADVALNSGRPKADSTYCIINKVKCNGQKVRLATKNDFFKTEVITKVFDDRIEFTHPSLNYRGRTIRPTVSTDAWYRMEFFAPVAEGKYLISEDSNEDLLIIEF